MRVGPQFLIPAKSEIEVSDLTVKSNWSRYDKGNVNIERAICRERKRDNAPLSTSQTSFLLTPPALRRNFPSYEIAPVYYPGLFRKIVRDKGYFH